MPEPYDRAVRFETEARGLYVIGSRQEEDFVSFPVEGIDGPSVSMLTVQVGT